MSLDKLDTIVSKIETNLQRDWMISAPFQDIERNVLNRRRRMTAILFNVITCIESIRAWIGTVAGDDSPLHFYSLNALFGYGFIGRFLHGCYSISLPGTAANFVVFFMNEGRGTLSVVTGMREGIKKLGNASTSEFKILTLYLTAMLYVRDFVRVCYITPMTVFMAIGAVITAIKFKSVSFGICYIPFWILFIFHQQYVVDLYAYLNIIIAQSTIMFKIRLTQVDHALRNTISVARSTSSDRKYLQLKKRMTQIVSDSLFEMDILLKEINGHNLVIKQWLRDVELYAGAVFAMSLVFISADVEWYYRLLVGATITFLMLALCPSFLNASDLHARLRKTAKLLHSCQTVLQIRRYASSRLNDSQFLESRNMLKIKFRVMRMIHRLTSHSVKVGFSVGDMSSFSPMTTLSFIGSTVTNCLMFMMMQTSLSSLVH